eukprot:s3491_g8.t1
MFEAQLHQAEMVNEAAVDKVQVFHDAYNRLKKMYEEQQDAHVSLTDELRQLRERQGHELEQLQSKSAARERELQRELDEQEAARKAEVQRMQDARDGWKIGVDARIANMAKSNQEEQRRLQEMHQKEKERTAIAHTVSELICFAFFCRI